MLRIEINGQPAHIKKGTSIKVTRENPRYTDSGDYTLEVTFPIDGCPENMKIFGPLHRPETEKARLAKTTYQFSLTADELNLEGTAVVTSVNEKEVKLQFLAGRSELNFKTTHPDGTDIYIDQLDLGIVWPDKYTALLAFPGAPSPSEEKTPLHAEYLTVLPDSIAGYDKNTLMYGNADQTDCVCLPIYSTAESRYANAREAQHFYDPDTQESEIFWIWPFNKDTRSESTKPYQTQFTYAFDPSISFAPQPYLVFILEEVLRAIGTPLSREDNCIRNTWMRDIFIANSLCTVRIADTLPHWTVKEFLQEIQNFFGVSIRAIDGKAVVVPLNNAENVTLLTKVIDNYSVEVEDEPQKQDISTVNVAFDYPTTNNHEILPDQVWDIAKIVATPSETTQDQYPKTLLRTSNGLMMDTGDGNFRRPVNYCAPYYADPTRRDTDLTLRIVPVKITGKTQAIVPAFVKGDNGLYHYTPTSALRYTLYGMKTDNPIIYTDKSELTIQACIDAEIQPTQKADTIEVALNTGMASTDIISEDYVKYATIQTCARPEGRPFLADFDTDLPESSPTRRPKFIITENAIPAPDTFRTTVIDPASDVDTYTKHVFDFVDRGFFSPSDDYIIRGRLYACEKIEYTINENGLDPKKKIHLFEKKTS